MPAQIRPQVARPALRARVRRHERRALDRILRQLRRVEEAGAELEEPRRELRELWINSRDDY